MKWLSESYREEGLGLVTELEDALLALQEQPETEENVDQACRALKDLRSSGMLAGFDAVAAFAGELASAFDQVRAGRLPVSRRLIHLTLAGRDQLRSMIEATVEDQDVARAAAEIAATLRRVTLVSAHPATLSVTEGVRNHPHPAPSPLPAPPGHRRPDGGLARQH